MYSPLYDNNRDGIPMSKYQSAGPAGSRLLGSNAEISELIGQLARKNAQLERMINKLGTRADNQDFRENFASQRQECKNLCVQILQLFKENRDGDKTMVAKLSRSYEEQLEKYTRLSRLVEQKDIKIVNVMSHSQDVGGQDMAADEESGLVRRDSRQLDAEVDVQFQVYDLEEIRKREQAIRQVERDVNELSEMFKDLHTLVETQQEQLDVIENNITQARDHTASAVKEVKQAEDYQKAARKKQCCLLFMIVGILTAVVVGAYFIFK